MKLLSLCCSISLLLVSISFTPKVSAASSADVPTAQSINFFKRQVSALNSVDNAVTNLLSRYPEKTVAFVEVALVAYPRQYEEIIAASVTAQPMFIDEIVRVATKHKVAEPSEIVSIAVRAEPSYAEIATNAACKYAPSEFTEIVRSAVKSEPDSADQIAQKLVTTFPNKTMEILVTTIKEVPYVGKYVLDALLAVVQEDDEKSETMIVMSVEQLAKYPDAMNRLVQLAQQHEIEREVVKQSAIKGGLSEEAIASILDEHYAK